jgi:hypothetical protein
MAAGPFKGLLELAYAWTWMSRIQIEGAEVNVNPDFHIVWILAGLIIVVIGHVFQYGVSLKEDSELTV